MNASALALLAAALPAAQAAPDLRRGILSLAALAAAIVLGLVRGQNAGVLGLVFAYGVGVLACGLPLREVGAGFPTAILLTLIGLTLLFSQARVNGTLPRLSGWAVQLCRGRPGLVPVLFFALAAALGTIGAGNIGATALLAPVAMAAAGELAVPPFLMAICVATGGNAAALSPLSPTGVVARGLLERGGLYGASWASYRDCLVAHAVIGLGGYLLLGGWRLLAAGGGDDDAAGERGRRLAALLSARREPLGARHLLTLAVLLGVFLAVAALGADLGAASLTGGALLSLLRAADEEEALRAMPWGTLLMLCGMMTLVSLLERSGGSALLAGLLGRGGGGGPNGALFLVALLSGLLSAYSSSVGVVLPTFLPLVPGLAAHSGAAPLSLASAVNIGAHLVDVSPLSTLGALCLAHAPASADRRRLYRQLLAWGLAMALVGALYCYVVLGVLRLR